MGLNQNFQNFIMNRINPKILKTYSENDDSDKRPENS
jgi:hypothetical protein